VGGWGLWVMEGAPVRMTRLGVVHHPCCSVWFPPPLQPSPYVANMGAGFGNGGWGGDPYARYGYADARPFYFPHQVSSSPWVSRRELEVVREELARFRRESVRGTAEAAPPPVASSSPAVPPPVAPVSPVPLRRPSRAGSMAASCTRPPPILSPLVRVRNPPSGPSASCGAPSPPGSKRASRGDEIGPATPVRPRQFAPRSPRAESPPPLSLSEGETEEVTIQDNSSLPSGFSAGSLTVPLESASLRLTLESARETATAVLLQNELVKAPPVVEERHPCPLVLGTPAPPKPTLPLLSSLETSILEPLQANLGEIPVKRGFLALPKKVSQIPPGESAWHCLASKDAELDRCLPLSGREASEDGKMWSTLTRSADSLGSSLQVVASLAAASKAKLEEFEVPDSVTDLLGALSHSVAYSLSLSAHLASSLRLQTRRHRLGESKVSVELKEDLVRLPLFGERLFPAPLKSILEREKEEATRDKIWDNFLKQTASAKKTPGPAPAKPQPKPQVPTRGGPAPRARGSKRKQAAPPSAQAGGPAKKPFPARGRGKRS
jgi:hypothetical protein